MPVINISAFAGEKPLITPRLLPATAAKAAFNVRLDDGALTPTKKSELLADTVSDAAHVTIYRHGDEWLSWATTVWATSGPVAQDRLYYTGDGAPKMRVDGDVYGLKVPRPTGALSGALSGGGSGDVQSRVYAYTFVTDFGEESAPSPASALIDWQPGDTVTLSGFEAAPAGREITKQRIYRSQTGSSGTFLYLIAERTAAATDYVDTIDVDDFQEVLPSTDWNEPPDGLSGLVSMPNGMMAGFVGRDVYFCEPWRPHAWPEKYILTCDSDVIGLGAIGSVLVVMTAAHPYIMMGAHPDSMQSQKLEANLPCINSRGIVDLGFAVCYPSNEGLVAVGADGSINLSTRQLFSREEWLSLSPTTIVGGQNAGNYVLFYDALQVDGSRSSGAMLINVSAAEYLVRSREVADAVFYDAASSALYYKRPDGTNLFRFDSPDMPGETLFWRSKEFWLNRPTNFGALQVDLGNGISLVSQAAIAEERAAITAANEIILAADGLNSSVNDDAVNEMAIGSDTLTEFPLYGEVLVSVYGDGKLVRSVSKVGTVERLPAGFQARSWEIAVSANVQVTQVIMAGTIDELRNTA
tara:strand:+ start:9076 stop:10821 length:1746 start_codon:yes stop_codon:yes gene_type:complete